MKRRRQIWLMLLGFGVIGAITAFGQERPVGQATLVRPLTSQEATIVVGTNGAILKDGKAWRGFGINYFSAFNRLIVNGDDVSSFSGLEVLAKHKIPFIRFACCGFWPNDWNLYRTNKSEYFRRLDRLVTEARNRNIGLIPSLFWYDACISDVVMEPRN